MTLAISRCHQLQTCCILSPTDDRCSHRASATEVQSSWRQGNQDSILLVYSLHPVTKSHQVSGILIHQRSPCCFPFLLVLKFFPLRYSTLSVVIGLLVSFYCLCCIYLIWGFWVLHFEQVSSSVKYTVEPVDLSGLTLLKVILCFSSIMTVN